ncbi:helix-turn-helix transcriptional regulator [Pseudonocardia sp. GCM10023141]|uniref:helix-turn-helix transcriptional regulator n=1 Tax=Pseudonocardia sp. GCM10023141 TaxID=3252653 RepID=UPI00361865F8
MPPPGSRPLLAAKLIVPPPRRGGVVRSRLHERLRPVPGVRLTTVIAPAGWGKTTLLSAWAQDPQERRAVGWLSIDEADDEPVRFWTYALAALGAVAPDLAGPALAALGAPGLDPVDVALAALLNALTDQPPGHVLVLDDYHLVTAPAIHESVEFLLAYLPPALHLVIASRADPPLPLARMRARGTLAEIRVDDLRCTPAEGAALVAAVGEIGAGAAGGLVERTEGWPAGLQLAALTLRGAADPTASAAMIRGDQRHILDYFAAEVLVTLDADQRALLVRSSVLERLSGPLCDAVLGSTGSAAVLDRLDRADLFVTPVGDRWYRCHRLFRDVLRRELDTTAPEEVSELLGRAADWFLANGSVEQAVEHRMAAGDVVGACRLMRENIRWFFDHGAMAALLRMGERVATAVPDAHLYLMLAFAAGLSGQARRSVVWLAAAEPLIADDDEPFLGWSSLRAAADTTWATYGTQGDVAAALRYAERAVGLESDPAQWGHVVALNSLAGALLGAGRVTEATEVLQRSWRSPARRELPTLMVLQFAGLLTLGLVELGHDDAARDVLTEVADVAAAAERAWGDGAAAAIAMLRLAEARLAAQHDPAAALAVLHRAAELAQRWGRPTVLVGALTSLADAQWATGDRAGARISVDRAREAMSAEPVSPVAAGHLDALEARLGRGAVNQARHRGEPVEELTDRELAVLRALRGPLSAREIGAELYLSINTVKGYTKSLYRKLDVVTRADAVRRGRDLGLI